MNTYLVTGGSGFLGSLLKHRLLAAGEKVINIDLYQDDTVHPNLVSVRGDIRDAELMSQIFRAQLPQAVFHFAAVLAHSGDEPQFLWTSNVDGTRVIAECSKQSGTRSIVFTSSNCLWGTPLNRPVTEADTPNPVELYGRSKLAAENILHEYRTHLDIVTLRCPTIIDSGRLGLLAILFEFIYDNRTVWTVGGGRNRYQFIYAPDLLDAALLASNYSGSDIFNVGSDNVHSLWDIYSDVIERAGSSSRIADLPRTPTLWAMKLAHALNISPLGPYHYKMIAEDFVFDTSRIKSRLGWIPTVGNEEMLFRAYQYYAENRGEIEQRTDVSAHRKSASMGVIRLLKWASWAPPKSIRSRRAELPLRHPDPPRS